MEKRNEKEMEKRKMINKRIYHDVLPICGMPVWEGAQKSPGVSLNQNTPRPKSNEPKLIFLFQI